MQSDTTVVSIAAVFFKKAAIIIATHGQKSLHWQLNRYVYNRNFWGNKLGLKSENEKNRN